MTKTEAIESKRGLPYRQIFEELSAETVSALGAIRGANLRDVVAVLAGGLQYRLDTAVLPPEFEPLRTALLVGFRHISMPDYAFNLAQPDVMGMLTQAVQIGLVTQAECDKFILLATYETAKYPDLTYRDVVAYFEPALLDGQWHELPETSGRNFVIRLLTAPPESTHIVIQMQDQYDDGSMSDWYHATALHGLAAAREYVLDRTRLPFNGYPRKLQWKCNYTLDAVVSVR